MTSLRLLLQDANGEGQERKIDVLRVSLQLRRAEVRETQVGSKPRSAARAETMGYARAFRRAFDWQRRCRSDLAVACPARSFRIRSISKASPTYDARCFRT